MSDEKVENWKDNNRAIVGKIFQLSSILRFCLLEIVLGGIIFLFGTLSIQFFLIRILLAMDVVYTMNWIAIS